MALVFVVTPKRICRRVSESVLAMINIKQLKRHRMHYTPFFVFFFLPVAHFLITYCFLTQYRCGGYHNISFAVNLVNSHLFVTGSLASFRKFLLSKKNSIPYFQRSFGFLLLIRMGTFAFQISLTSLFLFIVEEYPPASLPFFLRIEVSTLSRVLFYVFISFRSCY